MNVISFADACARLRPNPPWVPILLTGIDEPIPYRLVPPPGGWGGDNSGKWCEVCKGLITADQRSYTMPRTDGTLFTIHSGCAK